MIPASEFASRRQRFMYKMKACSIAILPSASIQHRNADVEYPYRQQSDFYYLTGFEEAEAIAVFMPKREKGEFILFNRSRDPDEEVWTGFRVGQEGACETYGAHQAFPIDSFERVLLELLEDRHEIYYSLGVNPSFDHFLLKTLQPLSRKIRGGANLPLSFHDVLHIVHDMRLIKSPTEIALMRKAAEISCQAHLRVMQYCKPQMNEYQLETEMLYSFNQQGARHVAYPSIIGSGKNSCILHYNQNNQIIQANSLVLVDAGCEYQNYASDITRTFPANGRFSEEQRAIYDIVLAAQEAGIQTVGPGRKWDEAQASIIKVITQGLLDLKILQGSLNTLLEAKAYLPFYMHNSGHWLGLDVHDVGCYKLDGKARNLQAGMVLTVEPGIYLSGSLSNLDKKWHNIGIRIEDDILVNETGNEILSQSLPKKIADIESLMP